MVSLWSLPPIGLVRDERYWRKATISRGGYMADVPQVCKRATQRAPVGNLGQRLEAFHVSHADSARGSISGSWLENEPSMRTVDPYTAKIACSVWFAIDKANSSRRRGSQRRRIRSTSTVLDADLQQGISSVRRRLACYAPALRGRQCLTSGGARGGGWRVPSAARRKMFSSSRCCRSARWKVLDQWSGARSITCWTGQDGRRQSRSRK